MGVAINKIHIMLEPQSGLRRETLSMAQEKIEATHKSQIESLSNLIFGLALSIGALTLIGQPPTDFQALLAAIAFYAFSFLILIGVWFGYTRTMALLHFENNRLVTSNILLLFLVSIEPFLFNQMISSSMPLVENVSIVYALDLGALFALQAFFSHSVLLDKSKPEQLLHSFRLRRNTALIGSSLFFVSTLPTFWIWTVARGFPLRLAIWLVTLFLPVIRHFWEKRGSGR